MNVRPVTARTRPSDDPKLGEHELPVPPLALSDLRQVPDLEALTGYEAAARHDLARAAHHQAEFDEAARLYHEALTLRQQANDRLGLTDGCGSRPTFVGRRAGSS